MWWIRSRTDSRKRLSYCRTDSYEWAPRISHDPFEHAYTALGHGRPASRTKSHGNTTAEGPLLMLVVCMCVRDHISISSTTTNPISLWIHLFTYTKPSWTQIRLFTPHIYIHGPHCKKKKKKLGQLKSLRQPASADFWVFSTYFLGNFSTFCCKNFFLENSKICWSWLP